MMVFKEPKIDGLTETGGVIYNPSTDKFYTFFYDKLSYYVINNDKRLRKQLEKVK